MGKALRFKFVGFGESFATAKWSVASDIGLQILKWWDYSRGD